jgi:uncharacterized protein (UPF0335 family)
MTGLSAACIQTYLSGGSADGNYPRDADDFGQCEAMLSAHSEFAASLHQMAELNTYWRALVPRWSEISAADRDGRNRIIAEIVRPIEQLDPGCTRIGIATMRIGSRITFQGDDTPKGGAMLDTAETTEDTKYNQACEFVTAEQKCSTSFIQRKLGIGYNAAARLVERMETEGLVSAPDYVGKREIHGSPNAFKPSPKAPLKETTDDAAVRDAAYNITADELRGFIERFEHLAAEKQDIAEQQKEVMSEAKGRGYNTKVMKKIIAERKRDKNDLAEEEAIMDLYKAALGMS